MCVACPLRLTTEQQRDYRHTRDFSDKVILFSDETSSAFRLQPTHNLPQEFGDFSQNILDHSPDLGGRLET